MSLLSWLTKKKITVTGGDVHFCEDGRHFHLLYKNSIDLYFSPNKFSFDKAIYTGLSVVIPKHTKLTDIYFCNNKLDISIRGLSYQLE